MPNWCSSRFAFIANSIQSKKELKRLYDNLNNTCNTHCPEENSFGDSWLGHVAIDHNIPWNRPTCRGSIDEIDEDITQLNKDTDYFIVVTESAWDPPTELFNDILEQYKGLYYVYLAEEEGCGLYINTDIKGDIFPERYSYWTEDTGSQYFKTEQELITSINGCLKANFKSIDDIEEYIKENPDTEIEVHRYLVE